MPWQQGTGHRTGTPAELRKQSTKSNVQPIWSCCMLCVFPLCVLDEGHFILVAENGVCDSDDGKVSIGFRGIFDNLVQKLRNKDLVHNLLTKQCLFTSEVP